MIFTDEMGILITPEIINFLKVALQREGKKSCLARSIGVTESNIGHWLGDTQQKGTYILWDQWKKVRAYLIKAELIDAEDPRWMLPSQMRERLMAIRGDSDVTARQSAVNTGTLNGSMTVNNQGRADAAELKSSIRMALIKTDGMCADCKLKAIAVIESV